MSKRTGFGRGAWQGIHDRYHAARQTLHERFPAAFTARGEAPVPLKVGIGMDLRALPDLGITPDQLYTTLHIYTGRKDYLRVMQEGAPRIDLVGAEVGIVTADHAAYAAAVLAGTRKHWWPAPEVVGEAA